MVIGGIKFIDGYLASTAQNFNCIMCVETPNAYNFFITFLKDNRQMFTVRRDFEGLYVL